MEAVLEKRIVSFKDEYCGIKEKCSAILKLSTKDNEVVSELSLFPPLHNISFDECLQKLQKTDLNEPKSWKNLPTPLLFALEAAFSRLKEDYLFPNSTIKSNKLISTPRDYVSGEKCYKVKWRAKEIIPTIQKENPNSKIRIDANRTLTYEDLKSFLSKTNKKNIEYLEEPLADLSAWNKIYDEFHIPLALDENLNNANETELRGISTWIIKPTLWGFYKTIELIDLAKKKNIRCVISSSFEYREGLIDLERLASYQNSVWQEESYHGLGTLEFLNT